MLATEAGAAMPRGAVAMEHTSKGRVSVKILSTLPWNRQDNVPFLRTRIGMATSRV
jgi:hypothetical protein